MLESIIASGFDVEELASALEPPERLTVSEWADRHRTLDAATSAEPGPWRTDRTPYLRAIMDAFNDPEVETVVFQAPTQVGKTECLLNILAYVIDQRPGPTMVVYPTVETAEDISRTRIQPMINSHSRLSAKKLEDRHLFTTTRMQFAGMDLFLSGANSAASLASKPCEYVLLDEVNKYPIQLKDEADPISLAMERTKTFPWSRKIFIVSTPTTQFGRITTELEDCDVVYDYHVSCPHCGTFQILRWAQVKWPKTEKDDPDRLRIVEEAAHYECEACSGVIYDHHKPQMLAAGEWRPAWTSTRRRKIGFRLSSLYSPWVKFGRMAVEFLRSKDFTERLQNFVNGWLGEPFEIRDHRPRGDVDTIMQRRDARMRGEVPADAVSLMAAVDVQEAHLYYIVRALLEDGGSALVDEGVVGTWDALEWLFWGRGYGDQRVTHVAVDTGFRTAECYRWTVAHRGIVVPLKGATFPMKAPHTISHIRTDVGSIDLWIIDTAYYKQMLLDLIQKGSSWSVHSDVSQEYCQQMVAERLEEQINKRTGARSMVWVLPSGAQNHFWDCEVYWLFLSRVVGRAVRKEPVAMPSPQRPSTTTKQWIQTRARWL